MNKPIIIVFEGFDKTGKTTLINELNNKINYKYIVLDRFIISTKIYDSLFKRNNKIYCNNFEKIIKENFNCLVVLCECDKENIIKRLINNNELLPKELKDIDNIIKMFKEETFNYEDYIVINTNNSINDCIEVILNKITEMENKNDT